MAPLTAPSPPSSIGLRPRGSIGVNPDAELTVEATRAHAWECVRLLPRAKKPPPGRPWQITKDPTEVAAWFRAGSTSASSAMSGPVWP